MADTTALPTTAVVVMGVSGTGKSTVGVGLARALGCDFVEGDDLHPAANVEKMRSGTPLDDDDRWPWLRAVADRIGAHERAGTDLVVTCSALKRSYRDLLRDGHPSVWFAHIDTPHDVLVERLRKRRGHYMPGSLLESQLATLEPLAAGEPGHACSGQGSAQQTVDALLAELRTERPR